MALVFDQAVADMPEGQAVISNFDRLGIEIIKANTLDELAAKINVPADALKETVTSFNAAVQNGQALAADPPKAAHAVRIEKPPFYALYPLGPGITLTFGGIRINLRRQALDADGKPIGGLYPAGECVGGYFVGDYVGGASLTRCLVDGRIAGRNTAPHAESRRHHHRTNAPSGPRGSPWGCWLWRAAGLQRRSSARSCWSRNMARSFFLASTMMSKSPKVRA